MKALGWPVFGLLVVVFTAMFATGVYATLHDEDKDPPEVAARKAECRKVIDHIIALTPEHGEVQVPIEDVEQCGAAYAGAVACMAQAQTLDRVKDCIPTAVECKGPVTEVTGDRPVYEVSGDCQTVRVTASNASVNIKAATEVEVTGNHDRVDLPHPEGKPVPKATDHGTGNTIQ